MAIQTWRRFHGEFVADVVATFPDRYRVVIAHATSGVTRELPKVFFRLESAKAAADVLVRRVFAHRCDIDCCGTWLQWRISSDAG